MEMLKNDEAVFAETKASCKAKADDWSTRCRMRTVEPQGINKAIEILSSPETVRTFTAARSTLLQTASVATLEFLQAPRRR